MAMGPLRERARGRRAVEHEAAGAIRLLACADARFEEIEVSEGNAERWVVRMNDETRAMVSSSIDEATATAEAEVGRKLTADEAVDFALDLLR
jgi:hypothetical protein